MPTSNTPNNCQKVLSRRTLQRASAACVACRARRTRCILSAVHNSCQNCIHRGRACVFTGEDERKKPRSRQHVKELSNQVRFLQQRLGPSFKNPVSGAISTDQTQVHIPFPSDTSFWTESQPSTEAQSRAPAISYQPNYSGRPTSNEQGASSEYSPSVVEHIVSTRPASQITAMDRQVRYFYFGPITNSAIMACGDEPDGSEIDDRRALSLIRALSPETHQYLMDLYWTHYNSVLCVAQRQAYEDDFARRRTGYYSSLLHVCMLAIGYRFADKAREDIKVLGRGHDALESTFHHEAKYMIEHELELPRGLTTICALLLFGDLECGIGRDNVGWMMHAMAVRITLDLRLNRASSSNEHSDQEFSLRSTTLWAVVAYDRFWALFGQRPTTIKLDEIEMTSCCVDRWPQSSSLIDSDDDFPLDSIYRALLDLLSIAGRIYDQPRCTKTRHIAQMHKTSLDRELDSWFANLNPKVSAAPAMLRKSPPSVFLLHIQYHSVRILLHWPFVEHPGAAGPSHYFAMTEARRQEVRGAIEVCKDAAVSIVRLYQSYKDMHDVSKLFITCIQHTAIAASALIAACYIEDVSSDARKQYLQHLGLLRSVLNTASSTYRPAGVMCSLLDKVFIEFSSGVSPRSVEQSVRADAANEVKEDVPEDDLQRFLTLDETGELGNGWEDPLIDDEFPEDPNTQLWQHDLLHAFDVNDSVNATLV